MDITSTYSTNPIITVTTNLAHPFSLLNTFKLVLVLVVVIVVTVEVVETPV